MVNVGAPQVYYFVRFSSAPGATIDASTSRARAFFKYSLYIRSFYTTRAREYNLKLKFREIYQFQNQESVRQS